MDFAEQAAAVYACPQARAQDARPAAARCLPEAQTKTGHGRNTVAHFGFASHRIVVGGTSERRAGQLVGEARRLMDQDDRVGANPQRLALVLKSRPRDHVAVAFTNQTLGVTSSSLYLTEYVLSRPSSRARPAILVQPAGGWGRSGYSEGRGGAPTLGASRFPPVLHDWAEQLPN